MASSESEDDIVIASFHLLTSIVQEKHKLNQRGQKRNIWQREWIAKRSQYGAYNGLVREIVLRDTDPAAYDHIETLTDGQRLFHSSAAERCTQHPAA